MSTSNIHSVGYFPPPPIGSPAPVRVEITPSVLRLAENDDNEPCGSCGNPRKPHNYRHRFVPTRCQFCGFKLDQCLCSSEAAHP